MKALLQVLAAVLTIAILWGFKAAVFSQGESFAQGFGAGALTLLGVLLLYRRFVGPIDG